MNAMTMTPHEIVNQKNGSLFSISYTPNPIKIVQASIVDPSFWGANQASLSHEDKQGGPIHGSRVMSPLAFSLRTMGGHINEPRAPKRTPKDEEMAACCRITDQSIPITHSTMTMVRKRLAEAMAPISPQAT
jgi:hypothetical protein